MPQKMQTIYTPSLTKMLKKANTLYVQIIDGEIFVGTSTFIVKVTRQEYDKFVKPVTKENIEYYYGDNVSGVDYKQRFQSETSGDARRVTEVPIMERKSKELTIRTCFCKDLDFVSGIDMKYLAMFDANEVIIYQKSIRSPFIFCDIETTPLAIVCPFRLGERMQRTVKFFMENV